MNRAARGERQAVLDLLSFGVGYELDLGGGALTLRPLEDGSFSVSSHGDVRWPEILRELFHSAAVHWIGPAPEQVFTSVEDAVDFLLVGRRMLQVGFDHEWAPDEVNGLGEETLAAVRNRRPLYLQVNWPAERTGLSDPARLLKVMAETFGGVLLVLEGAVAELRTPLRSHPEIPTVGTVTLETDVERLVGELNNQHWFALTSDADTGQLGKRRTFLAPTATRPQIQDVAFTTGASMIIVPYHGGAHWVLYIIDRDDDQ